MSISAFKNLSDSGELLIDLGVQPVSNRFLELEMGSEAPCFPFQLRIRMDSGLIHQGNPFPVTELKPRFNWLTCFEPEDHLDDMVQTIIALPGINQDAVFGAYSFKDDSTLRRLEKIGYTKTWRLDPVNDLGVTDTCANVETYQDVLSVELAVSIAGKKGLADILIVRHVIEHSYDLPRFIDAMKALTHPNGYIVWELPDCERALAAGDCTTIWEEHTYYFTSYTFHELLINAGFSFVHFESVPYPFENSLVAIVKFDKPLQEQAVKQQAVDRQVNLARSFVTSVMLRKVMVREKLQVLKENYGLIVLFGAGHLSVAFLSLMGVADLIDFVIDDNPNKRGMSMPIGNLRILGSESLYSHDVRVCLLSLNPSNQPKVIEKHIQFVSQGGRFASIFPGGDLDLVNIS